MENQPGQANKTNRPDQLVTSPSRSLRPKNFNSTAVDIVTTTNRVLRSEKVPKIDNSLTKSRIATSTSANAGRLTNVTASTGGGMLVLNTQPGYNWQAPEHSPPELVARRDKDVKKSNMKENQLHSAEFQCSSALSRPKSTVIQLTDESEELTRTAMEQVLATPEPALLAIANSIERDTITAMGVTYDTGLRTNINLTKQLDTHAPFSNRTTL